MKLCGPKEECYTTINKKYDPIPICDMCIAFEDGWKCKITQETKQLYLTEREKREILTGGNNK